MESSRKSNQRRWVIVAAGSRVLEAGGGARSGQRRAVLSGAGAHLRRPELQPAEPLGRHPGVGAQGRLRGRAVRRGPHRDDAHPHVAVAHGTFARSRKTWPQNSPEWAVHHTPARPLSRRRLVAPPTTASVDRLVSTSSISIGPVVGAERVNQFR